MNPNKQQEQNQSRVLDDDDDAPTTMTSSHTIPLPSRPLAATNLIHRPICCDNQAVMFQLPTQINGDGSKNDDNGKYEDKVSKQKKDAIPININ